MSSRCYGCCQENCGFTRCGCSCHETEEGRAAVAQRMKPDPAPAPPNPHVVPSDPNLTEKAKDAEGKLRDFYRRPGALAGFLYDLSRDKLSDEEMDALVAQNEAEPTILYSDKTRVEKCLAWAERLLKNFPR